ncbi:MAG: hypothetical protein ACREGI_05680, partial [Candidatus Levyibacteriota bacterium]
MLFATVKKFRYPLLVIFLSVLPFISFFLTSNLPHTSDGIPHLARIAAYYKELTRGQFPVRWAGDLNFGYGSPIFVFFTPLPYMIGSILLFLGIGLVLSLKFLFLFSFLLSGIFMYLFAKEFFQDEKMAFLATIFYQFAPFHLVEIVVRGSLGSDYSYSFL